MLMNETLLKNVNLFKFHKGSKLKILKMSHFIKGAFTIYVYMARWVDGQNSGKFVNVYSIEIVNEGR